MTGTGVLVSFGPGTNDSQVLSTADITGNTDFNNFGFGPYTAVSSGSAILSQAIGVNLPVLGPRIPTRTICCWARSSSRPGDSPGW